jgi:hypothetical protein
VLPDRDDRRLPRVPGQIRRNADALGRDAARGRALARHGGTDTHLLLVDLSASEWTGKAAEERLHEIDVTVNRNTIPFDERSPFVTSGIRLGSPAMTMRGFDEDDFREVGRIICEALTESPDLDGLRGRVATLCAKRPLYEGSAATRRTSLDGTAPHRRQHPLIQHKLGYLRDKETPTVHFRKLANEITLLLTYEATKDMPTEDAEVETPLER